MVRALILDVFGTVVDWRSGVAREVEAFCDALGPAAIEMESAALYAFAAAKARPVLCFAHVTNTMAVTEVDFEKGDAQGALDSLRLLDALLSGEVARESSLAIPPAQETVPGEADSEKPEGRRRRHGGGVGIGTG